MNHRVILRASDRPLRRAIAALATLLVIVALSLPRTARAEEEPLVMGVFPRNKATETVTMYTPLADHLSERLGRKVTLVTAKDFEAFWKGVTEGRYDIVHYNQYHYARSSHAYRVIAHNQEFGKNAVAGALFVRKDSGITHVSQLRGRTIVFGGGKDAMLSYIGPRFLLMQAGLREQDFKSEFAVNPPNAMLALYSRQVDAAGGGDILIDLQAVRNAIDASEIRMLAATEPLLFLPWAVKRNMAPTLADTIQKTMIELAGSEAGRKVLQAARTTGLVKAGDKDYDPHRRMVNAVFGSDGTAK
jgi:phosphonate transport system substrate-binding protein